MSKIPFNYKALFSFIELYVLKKENLIFPRDLSYFSFIVCGYKIPSPSTCNYANYQTLLQITQD